MGLSNSNLNFFDLIYKRKYLRGNRGRCLGLSTLDFYIDYGALQLYGIDTIAEEDIIQHESLKRNSDEWCESCKQLNTKLWKFYGYDFYEELDINKRADILWDLNYPIPDEYIEKYDLIIDSAMGYVANFFQAYINSMKMLKIGGEMILNLHLTNVLNRFPLNPAINFMINFLNNNGFKVYEAIIFKHTSGGGSQNSGYINEYPTNLFNNKITYLRDLLPWEELFRFRLKQLFCDASKHADKPLAEMLTKLNEKCFKWTSLDTYVVHLVSKKERRISEEIIYPHKDFYKESYIFKT